MAEEHAYDDAYSSTQNLFGSQPDRVLVDHIHLLDKTRPVLDVGSGQGRHALYLARNGFEVVALDTSGAATRELRDVVEREQLPIHCVEGSIELYDPGGMRFGTVLVFGLVQILTWDQIRKLINHIDQLTRPDGIVILTGWTVDDSSHTHARDLGEQLGPNSYRLPNGNVRTYLESGQIRDLLAGWEVIYHWEGIGDWHRHGDSDPERHARVEAVFQKA